MTGNERRTEIINILQTEKNEQLSGIYIKGMPCAL